MKEQEKEKTRERENKRKKILLREKNEIII